MNEQIKEQMKTNSYWIGFKQVQKTDWHKQKRYCDKNIQGKYMKLAWKVIPDFESY